MSSLHDIRAPDPRELAAHIDFVRAIARELTSDGHGAEDLTQQTMLAALAHRGARVRSVRSWLAGIARKLTLMQRRGEARRSRHLDALGRHAHERMPDGCDDPVTQALHRVETRRLLVDAVLALPRPYRDAIVLRYMEGLRPREIATTLELPLNTVRSHLARGLDKLRRSLDEAHDGKRSAWHGAVAALLLPGPGAVGATRMAWKPWAAAGSVVAVCVVAGVALWNDRAIDRGPDRLDDVDPRFAAIETPGPELEPIATSRYVPTPGDGVLCIRLVDQYTGDPVPAAHVRAYPAMTPRGPFPVVRISEELPSAVVSDAAGRVVLPLPPSDHVVVNVRRSGFVAVTGHVAARPASGEVVVALTPTTTLRLVRGPTAPPGPLDVELFATGGTPQVTGRPEQLAAEEAVLEIVGCAPGSYLVRASSPGAPELTVVRRVRTHAGDQSLYDARLVAVDLLLSRGSARVPWISPPTRWLGPPPGSHEQPKPRSRWPLGSVEPGDYDVCTVTPAGTITRHRVTIDGAAPGVTVAVPDAVHELTIDTESPSAHVAVSRQGSSGAHRLRRAANSEGFARLSSGPHVLHVLRGRTWMRHVFDPAEVPERRLVATSSNATLHDLAITCVDRDGVPVDGLITLQDADGVAASLVRIVSPRPRGAPLDSTVRKTHHWRVSPGRYVVLGKLPTADFFRPVRTVEVADHRSVRVVLERGRDIVVRLLDDHGSPVSNAPVVVSRDRRGWDRKAVTDGEGNFAARLHHRDRYRVRLLDGRLAELSFEHDANRVDLAVR